MPERLAEMPQKTLRVNAGVVQPGMFDSSAPDLQAHAIAADWDLFAIGPTACLTGLPPAPARTTCSLTLSRAVPGCCSDGDTEQIARPAISPGCAC